MPAGYGCGDGDRRRFPGAAPARSGPTCPCRPARCRSVATADCASAGATSASTARTLMLCAARAEVGPTDQSFWVLWDREQRPRARPHGAAAGQPRGRRSTARALDDRRPRPARRACASASAQPIESICPSGERLGLDPQARRGADRGHGRDPRAALAGLDGFGVDDESAGYQARHTSWHWSAGVGTATDGRALAWNLVEGINDPPRTASARSGSTASPPSRPPVRFDGLERGRLRRRLTASTSPPSRAHARDDNFLLVRSTYRHRFGTFTGSLDGHRAAPRACGVMESHDALW